MRTLGGSGHAVLGLIILRKGRVEGHIICTLDFKICNVDNVEKILKEIREVSMGRNFLKLRRYNHK